MMAQPAAGKREQNTARTREKLIDAAVLLYGERSIDAVSLREISTAAGQKNANALQYHFTDKDGLLQAIVDKHALAITDLRTAYIQRAEQGEWSLGEAAARTLVMPIIRYVESAPGGLNYVKIVSQIAALYQNGAMTRSTTGIQFPRNEAMVTLFGKALASVPPREAQRRIYLVVNCAFHSIADIYGAAQGQPRHSAVASRKPMVEQLILLLESFFTAPSRAGIKPTTAP